MEQGVGTGVHLVSGWLEVQGPHARVVPGQT